MRALDPRLRLARAEARMCNCGATTTGEKHTGWCPAEQFDHIPPEMSAKDALVWVQKKRADRKPPTAELVRELLIYNPETGVFTWRVNRGWLKAGTVAGSPHRAGYTILGIALRMYRAHRIAWLYMTGKWPADAIDHINGIRDDNRWANLREATWQENLRSTKRRIDNTSGFKGVRKEGTKWVASIYPNRKRIKLGTFDTPEEAHAAYCAAAEQLYGEFARPE